MYEQIRCYRCWKLLDHPGPASRDRLQCSECGTRLFLYAGKPAIDVLKGKAVTAAEYSVLLGSMLKAMAEKSEIYKGETEPIAGVTACHWPDAVYYRKGDILMRQPVICEIETCQTFNDPNTLSKCRLFAQTAMNLNGLFHLFVPAECDGAEPVGAVEELLKTNGIEPVRINALSVAKAGK